MSEKKSYFNVENNRLWNKMSIFHLLLREIEIGLQNQIKRTISGIKPRFSPGYSVFEEIKISHLAIITIFGLLPVFRVLPVIGHV